MRFAYIVNSSDFFCSHFINLAESLKSQKNTEVHIIVGDNNKTKELEEKGFIVHYIALSRKGINPLTELKTIFKLRALLKSIKPDLVHSFTIKPIVYTGLSTSFSFNGISRKVYSVTGLGSLFLSRSLKNRFLWRVVKLCYRYTFSSPKARVFFENTDDMDLFVKNNLVSREQVLLVHGAGIDTNHFRPLDVESLEPSNQLVITFVGRLLKDKGVRELIEASKVIYHMKINVKILVVGNVDDDNISSLNIKEVNFAHDKGYINYLGHRTDIYSIYQLTDVACLPSYREGLPKSLIEASSSGCAILTTDSAGCRQMVLDGRNGLLCQVKSSSSLVEKILYFYENREVLERMKLESRKVALERFGHEMVNRTFFRGYGI